MPAHIYTPLIDYTFYEDSVVEVRYNRSLPLITREVVMKTVEDRRRYLSPQRSRYLLLHIREDQPSTSLAWSVLSDMECVSGIQGVALYFKGSASWLDDITSMIKEPCTPVRIFRELDAARSWLSALAPHESLVPDNFLEHYGPTPTLRGNADKSPRMEYVTLDEVCALIDKALSFDRNEKERRMLVAARRELLYVPDPSKIALTPTEQDIVGCMALGMTTRDIAEYQNKSHRTVEIQKQKLYRKVGVSSGGELVQRVRELGLA